MARVVFDARTKTHFRQQLEIVKRALLQPLRFEQLALVAQLVEPLPQLVADAAHRLLHALLAGHVMARRIDGRHVGAPQHLAAHRVDLADRLDRVVEELDAQRRAIFVGRKDLDDVAAHAESAAVKIVVAALVLDVDELAQHLIAIERHALFQINHQLEISLRRAEAVDARHAGDDQRVAPLEQRLGRGVAQLVDLVVDRSVFLDDRCRVEGTYASGW